MPFNRSFCVGALLVLALLSAPAEAATYTFGGNGGPPSQLGLTDCVGMTFKAGPSSLTLDHFDVEIQAKDTQGNPTTRVKLHWYLYPLDTGPMGQPGYGTTWWQGGPMTWYGVTDPTVGPGPTWESSPPVGVNLSNGAHLLLMCWEGVNVDFAVHADPGILAPECMTNACLLGAKESDLETGPGVALPSTVAARILPMGYHMRVALLEDLDGDGWTDDVDCDDADPTLNLDDVDGDGWTTCDGDCDDTDPYLNFDDVDGDGASTCDGDCDDTNPTFIIGFDNDQDGWTDCGGDCDDADPAINPGAIEDCDGTDNDCDGIVDWLFRFDVVNNPSAPDGNTPGVSLSPNGDAGFLNVPPVAPNESSAAVGFDVAQVLQNATGSAAAAGSLMLDPTFLALPAMCIEFDVLMETRGASVLGDGYTLGIFDANTVSASSVGNTGGALGAQCLNGHAIEFDLQQNRTDLAVPHVEYVETTNGLVNCGNLSNVPLPSSLVALPSTPAIDNEAWWRSQVQITESQGLHTFTVEMNDGSGAVNVGTVAGVLYPYAEKRIGWTAGRHATSADVYLDNVHLQCGACPSSPEAPAPE